MIYCSSRDKDICNSKLLVFQIFGGLRWNFPAISKLLLTLRWHRSNT